MKRTEAPPPGWYPDPTGRSGLLWWDGRDWTTHRRPRPVPGSEEGVASAAAHEAAAGPGRDPDRAPGVGSSAGAAAGARRRRTEREVADAVAEARRVARAEVDRAVQEARRELTRARDEWQPRLMAYLRRTRRWFRIAVVVVVVLVALSAWSSVTLQTGLLEWLGERVDAVVGTVAPSPPDLPAGGARQAHRSAGPAGWR